MKDEEKVVVEVKKESRGEEWSILSGIGTMPNGIIKRHVLPKTTSHVVHTGINQNPLCLSCLSCAFPKRKCNVMRGMPNSKTLQGGGRLCRH